LIGTAPVPPLNVPWNIVPTLGLSTSNPYPNPGGDRLEEFVETRVVPENCAFAAVGFGGLSVS
jgi:hypothetical protein